MMRAFSCISLLLAGVDIFCLFETAPTAWVVLEPEYTISHDVEVFIASTSGTIYVLDFDECQDQVWPLLELSLVLFKFESTIF